MVPVHPWHTLFNVRVFLFLSSYFLALQDAPNSSRVFPDTVLERAVSLRSPGSFYWRMVLEAKIRVLGVFVATGASFLLGSLT